MPDLEARAKDAALEWYDREVWSQGDGGNPSQEDMDAAMYPFIQGYRAAARIEGLADKTTGIFVRVERDGKWESLEIDTLTDDEINTFTHMKRQHHPTDGWNWVNTLARWIRDQRS